MRMISIREEVDCHITTYLKNDLNCGENSLDVISKQKRLALQNLEKQK
jgi:hypothetical protein